MEKPWTSPPPCKEGDHVILLHFDDLAGKRDLLAYFSPRIGPSHLAIYGPMPSPLSALLLENGFYYDFADLHISDADFEKIEKEMQKIVDENYVSQKEKFATKEEAIKTFAHNKYKMRADPKFCPCERAFNRIPSRGIFRLVPRASSL